MCTICECLHVKFDQLYFFFIHFHCIKEFGFQKSLIYFFFHSFCFDTVCYTWLLTFLMNERLTTCKNVQKSAFYTWIANFSLPDWAHFTMLIIVSKINCLKPSFLFTADKQKKPIHWVFHHFSAKNRTHILNKKWNISCIVELWYLFIWF